MFKKNFGVLTGIFVLGLLAYFLTSQNPRHQTPLSSAPEKIRVLTSFYPLAEFAQQVGLDKVAVQNLTPPGVEPHDFEPTPQDLIALQKSQVFIYNGAGLELWLDKLDPDIKKNVEFVNASQDLPLLSGETPDEDHQNSTTRPDPHVWLDPVLASQQVNQVKNGLRAADPANTASYEQHAAEYQQKLLRLDESFRTGLAECERRDIVTSHNAFQYLAKRYNLNVLSISGLTPDEEPTPKALAEVADFVKEHQVKYIFFETLVSPKLAETIAQETGAQTIAFNPLEGLAEAELQQGKNYLSVQNDNLVALKTALGCK
jgi:zinc transport system substrate-binding protein